MPRSVHWAFEARQFDHLGEVLLETGVADPTAYVALAGQLTGESRLAMLRALATAVDAYDCAADLRDGSEARIVRALSPRATEADVRQLQTSRERRQWMCALTPPIGEFHRTYLSELAAQGGNVGATARDVTARWALPISDSRSKQANPGIRERYAE
jgi:hypothetical protein